ncbi:MAG: globin, partial [Actinomycetota bacterium]|nr:globin [Actinomycetota bacterium]
VDEPLAITRARIRHNRGVNAPAEPTPYEMFGGRDFFTRLVAAFYSRVADDDVLRPMYPPGSLDAAEWRLRSFLEQYWGGPTDYSDQRGHPRLRMRHAGFSIDSTARDRWLTHMRAAVDEQDLPPDHERILWQYLQGAAFAMQNVADKPPAGDVFTAHPTT